MNAVVEHKAGALAQTEGELLQVLQSSLYPGAAVPSIKLVLGYCKAAGLDPMQKPVHIVPMWDPKNGQMRDVVMPGINLYRTQASRSKEMAGISDPEFGPMVTQSIGGQEITFPEWCRVTVKRRMNSGEIAEFSATEFWMENYATKGGKEKSIAPNAMWTKRPRGQLAKCAEAQALRKAFPEFSGAATAEEMEGKTISADDGPPPPPQAVEMTPQQRAEWETASRKGRKESRKFWQALPENVRAGISEEEKQAMWAIAEAADTAPAQGQQQPSAAAPAPAPADAPPPPAAAPGAPDPWLEEMAAAEAGAKPEQVGSGE